MIASAIITKRCGRYRFTWSPFWCFENAIDRGQSRRLAVPAVSVPIPVIGLAAATTIAVGAAVAVSVTVAISVVIAVVAIVVSAAAVRAADGCDRAADAPSGCAARTCCNVVAVALAIVFATAELSPAPDEPQIVSWLAAFAFAIGRAGLSLGGAVHVERGQQVKPRLHLSLNGSGERHACRPAHPCRLRCQLSALRGAERPGAHRNPVQCDGEVTVRLSTALNVPAPRPRKSGPAVCGTLYACQPGHRSGAIWPGDYSPQTMARATATTLQQVRAAQPLGASAARSQPSAARTAAAGNNNGNNGNHYGNGNGNGKYGNGGANGNGRGSGQANNGNGKGTTAGTLAAEL